MAAPISSRSRTASLSARAAGLALGVVMDRVLGDPSTPRHPVAWFGRYTAQVEQRLWRDDKASGVAYVAATVVPAVAAAAVLQRATRGSWWSQAALTAVTSWTVIAAQGLEDAAHAMHTHLERGELPEARDRLSYLCARDATDLSRQDLARATVESVAENASDAVIAPLMWGSVAGLPGLVGYRAINTLDSMVGYRSARYRNFGWAAARLDDLVNYLPARLTALITVWSAGVVGGDSCRADRIWQRDAQAHPSPNAGHPEAAFAGALGVRLGGANAYAGEGVEHRALMGDGHGPAVADIPRATRLMSTVVQRAAGALIVITVMRALLRPRR